MIGRGRLPAHRGGFPTPRSLVRARGSADCADVGALFVVLVAALVPASLVKPEPAL